MALRIPVSALRCDSTSPQHGSGPRAHRLGSSGRQRSPRNDDLLESWSDTFDSEGSVLPPADEPWLVMPRYELVCWLGRGSYGGVAEARDTQQENRTVAIKRVQGVLDDECFCRYAAREVSLMRLLEHPGIVRLIDVLAPKAGLGDFNEIYMVMEKCHSDLRKFCESATVVELRHIKRMTWTLLLGLTYLHSACVWHRDLKPANCLLNEDCSIKIADFGLARAVGRTQQFHHRGPERQAPLYDSAGNCNLKRGLTRQVGTKAYRAPEMILRQQKYTEMVDVWSVGCIYAELLWTVEGVEESEQRGAQLFNGRACYPLSDDHLGTVAGRPAEDILETVFDLIGTPSEEEVARLECERARRYLRTFPNRQGAGLQATFPHADTGSVDLLSATLRFDPDARLTARQLLQHNGIFDQVRHDDEIVLAPGRIDWPLDEQISGDKEDTKAVLAKEIWKLRRRQSQ